MILDCSALFCMALYTTLYGVMTASISCLNFSQLSKKFSISKEWLIKLLSTYSSFFQALVFSCSISPSVKSSAWESGTYCIWVFSKFKNPSRATLWASMWMFPTVFYWLRNPWMQITAVGKSVFQQPFKATDFIIHAFLYIYYAVSSVVQFPALSNRNKGLCTCSENTAEGAAAHVMALECCDSSLVK